MVRKKVDNRIRVLIENGVHTGHRSMFVIVGDKGRDQVVILHHMLSKAEVKARPNILWCYKKELGFSSHRKKRMRHLQKKIQSGKVDVNEDDPFELFIASTNIRYCYYAESHKILGNTYGMCVLQDFEALTPNLLARTIETVEGGGIIIILLRSVNSLKQLYTMTMDVHSRFRTEAHQDVVGRFNERFMLSLGTCDSCIVMDDGLNILPISSNTANISPVEKTNTTEDPQLKSLKESLQDTQPVGVLVNCCKTVDQAQALLKFIDSISEKRLDATVSLTAARGRGKSAALGLAMAAAIAFGYSNIYVTSPSPENLKTLFEFVFKGFEVLQYQEHIDFDLVQSTSPEFNKAVVRVNFFRDHRQTIQYIQPNEAMKLGQAELLVIDEAAAIPLPLVKSLFGPYLVFLASTISGYEGTGRSLSLKLIQQLRVSGSKAPPAETDQASNTGTGTAVSGRTLREVVLEESIRYKAGDSVEAWLTGLLCLDATLTPPITSGCPPPNECELYYISRDTLFSYHKASEMFLQRIISLYVSSHYKNSPNDLQLISDAPAHHLFCLLGPVDPDKKSLPEVLCVIQVCLEGELSKANIADGLQRGKRASGDLIPWTIAQQFQDSNFPSLCGARIVRIATHPDYQGMGYGSRAIKLLQEYYSGKMIDLGEKSVEEPIQDITGVPDEDLNILSERIVPRKNLPPLLLKLTERSPEVLHYIGVSYGVTLPLLKFWKRAGYLPVYMRQTPNELTGEHSCIMLQLLHTETVSFDGQEWLQDYFKDFRRRFMSLLSYQFKAFTPALALSILLNKNWIPGKFKEITQPELQVHITPFDTRRLELYSKNMTDYHVVMDLVPTLAKLYFLNKMGNIKVSAVQSAILVGLGLQHKTVDELSTEIDLPSTQLLGLFNRTIRKVLEFMNRVSENHIHEQFLNFDVEKAMASMEPLSQSLEDEFKNAEKDLKKKQKVELEKLKGDDFSQFAIKGTDEVWSNALQTMELPAGSSITIKSGEKRLAEEDSGEKKKKRESPDGKKSFGKGWKKTGNKKKK
ncbi:RNA cytidine acetyltransferase [Folsomia candida]|uniref:RNA cytidine acetyltransferase n=1 Tax=Folsomia candida TaxID=158441 RepID=A0A226E783_FOLCA|nr:RNA cytidine acetyltransferase [Folsomia candida]OXA52954.1 N-acetyltransferase 10 [Folsomia candida]